jgi:hypothetical protein
MKSNKNLDYTYEEYYVDPLKTTFDLEEEDYIEFLKEHGHKDFRLISFLPDLRDVKEYEEKYVQKYLITERVQRTTTLLGENFKVEKETNNGRIKVHLEKKVVRRLK